MSMVKRRQLLKYGLVATGGLWVLRRGGLARAIPDASGHFSRAPETLPVTFRKYTWPLLIPPVMPQSDNRLDPGAPVDYYEIAARQVEERMLPPELDLPPTTVWRYGSFNHPETFSTPSSPVPSLTIEATWQRPVRVKWINDLKDNGKFHNHLFQIDPTIHWAQPQGGIEYRDTDCTDTFALRNKVINAINGTPPMNPVPLVTHLHGVMGAGQESDGYAEAWVLPAADDIPNDFATTGTFYDYFKGTSPLKHLWEPGASVYEYPNKQRAGTLWYHDHTLGITRLNVYAGLAGYYLIRGGRPDDLPSGELPGPAPRLGDSPETRVYEIPLVIQDRTFKTDGSLYYPEKSSPGDKVAKPFWVPMYDAETIVVNGRTWPYLEVEQRRYRFRVLNGCNSRFLSLAFSRRLPFWKIGADAGGFLPAPVELETLHLLPGERADIIVDFTGVPAGTEILLLNTFRRPEHTFSGLLHRADEATGEVMQLRVVQATSTDTSTPPDRLRLPTFTPHGPEEFTRHLLLDQKINDRGELRSVNQGEVILNGGTLTRKIRGFHDEITENPNIEATEIWELYNFTGMPHPIHIHDVEIQIVGREGLDGSSPSLPDPGEMGFRDTIVAKENAITRLKMKFRTPGLFMWHCHIVEHEDNDMMRPLHVGPIPDLPPPKVH